MPRSQPDHRRRRPGRRPPYCPSAGAFSGGPRPPGFTAPGMRQVFNTILPMQGRERRQFYNQASAGLVIGMGLAGGIIGSSWGGVLGAAFGFGFGITMGGVFVENGRFYRR